MQRIPQTPRQRNNSHLAMLIRLLVAQSIFNAESNISDQTPTDSSPSLQPLLPETIRYLHSQIDKEKLEATAHCVRLGTSEDFRRVFAYPAGYQNTQLQKPTYPFTRHTAADISTNDNPTTTQRQPNDNPTTTIPSTGVQLTGFAGMQVLQHGVSHPHPST